MRPDFALDFRDNQISLLHRADSAWVRLGHVDMADPDLDAALGYLRATALGLSPRGIASQLILPNDLILYTRLEGLSPDPALRAAQIGQGLVGRTPYDLADLVYDWTDEGDGARVAVVARETLTEAEGFAVQHRFNPVSFAAWPAPGDFDGEVWFGTTGAAQALLSPGEVVERDAARAFVILPEGALRSAVSAEDFEMGQAASPAAPHIAEGGAEADQPQAQAEVPPVPAPLPADPVEAAPELPEEHAAEVANPLAEPVVDTGPEAAPAPLAEAEAVAEAAAPQPEVLAPAEVMAPAPATAPPEMAPPRTAAPSTAAPLADFQAAYHAAPEVQDDEAPMALDVPQPDEGTPDEPPPDAPVTAPSPRPALLGGMPKLGPATGDGPRAETSRPEALRRAEDTSTATLRPPIVKHVPAIMPTGGKKNLSHVAKAKPKSRLGMGWILTLLLLLTLVAVAALSQMFVQPVPSLGENTGATSPSAVDQAALAQANPVAPKPTARQVDAAALPTAATPKRPLVTEAPAASANLDKTLAKPRQRPPGQAPALANGAAAGLGQVNLAKLPPLAQLAGLSPDLARPAPQPVLAPPEAEMPKADMVVNVALRSPALVPPPRPVQLLAAAASDAPLPYADPRLAAARPAPRPATASGQTEPLAVAAAATVAVNAAPLGLRPLPRPAAGEDLARASRLASAPASLVASAALNATEDQLLGLDGPNAAITLAALPGAEDLPGLRPEPRLTPQEADRSPLALAISPIPPARPKGLAAAFEQRQAAAAAAAAAAEAAANAPEPSAEPAEPAASGDDVAAAEAQGGEEVTRETGGTASRSLVAKQSTQRNAMNLSQVNLVGIFGRADNRYALIRRANGTFKKLKVGDRFDGGRIAAITETEVRYDKGGELVALTLPKG